jgi:hypothetical protein
MHEQRSWSGFDKWHMRWHEERRTAEKTDARVLSVGTPLLGSREEFSATQFTTHT